MAYVCLVINCPDDTIGNLNANTQNPTNSFESVNLCVNLLNSIKAGARSANVQVTVRDTDPAISTSGSGSTQNSYNLT